MIKSKFCYYALLRLTSTIKKTCSLYLNRTYWFQKEKMEWQTKMTTKTMIKKMKNDICSGLIFPYTKYVTFSELELKNKHFLPSARQLCCLNLEEKYIFFKFVSFGKDWRSEMATGEKIRMEKKVFW